MYLFHTFQISYKSIVKGEEVTFDQLWEATLQIEGLKKRVTSVLGQNTRGTV